jgi:hypothetical protein
MDVNMEMIRDINLGAISKGVWVAYEARRPGGAFFGNRVNVLYSPLTFW